ncbi:hypothetical protein GQ54DRAFT_324551 [Martensiomyces pterosporus]|nr:hypothetical protein GQ54DRAFT_324551 [Martensiomyces pterosporus]
MVNNCLVGYSEATCVNAIRALLAGDAQKYSQSKEYTTHAELLANLERAFPLAHHQDYIWQQVRSGKFFESVHPHNLPTMARHAFCRCGEADADAHHIAEVLAALQPIAWIMTATRPVHVTAADFHEKIDKFATFVEALPDTLHSVLAPTYTPTTVETTRSGQPAAASNPTSDTRSSKHRAARKARDHQLLETLSKLHERLSPLVKGKKNLNCIAWTAYVNGPFVDNNKTPKTETRTGHVSHLLPSTQQLSGNGKSRQWLTTGSRSH